MTAIANNTFNFLKKDNEHAAPILLSPPIIKEADQKVQKTTPGRVVVNPEDSRSPRGTLGKSPIMAGRMSRLDIFLNSPDRQSAGSPPSSPPTAGASGVVAAQRPEQNGEDAPPQRKIARAKRSKLDLQKKEQPKDVDASRRRSTRHTEMFPRSQ